MAEITLGQAEAVEERTSLRTLMLIWSALFLLLLPVLGILGLFMRAYQGQFFPELDAGWFYASLTLHGLGFAGLSYAFSFVAMLYVLSRYLRFKTGILWFSTILTVLGVVLLVVCFLLRFAPGWYFLYPLPFISQGAWPAAATDLFLCAVAVLGVAWLIWSLEVLRAIAERYSLSQALCWHYLRGSNNPEIPPSVLVATAGIIAGVISILAGVAMLIFFVLHRFTDNLQDPLLVKNLTFLFGHVLINISMFHAIAVVYAVFPQYSGHAWKTIIPMVVGWNLAVIFVLLAYLHHLYMDFAQPRAVQLIGQIGSYAASIPAAVVTILGILAQVYRRSVQWTIASSLIFLGTMGWAIGGIAAVIDATVAVNFLFHNTLWVPGHFHTYLQVGLIFILLGFVAHLTQTLSGTTERAGLARAAVTLLLVGGYGFVFMFYAGGITGVPRRFALYQPETEIGTSLAKLGLLFSLLVVVGLLFYLIEVVPRWFSAYRTLRQASSSSPVS